MKDKKCEKCEEWSIGFVILICSLLIVTLIWGLYISFASGSIAAIAFILLSIANLLSAFYSTCRHCYYYGKRCYLGFGLLVPFVFEKVNEPINKLKETVWMLIFIFNILYPLIFLFKQNPFPVFIIHSLLYLICPVLAMVLVSIYSCPRCKNTGCVMNPDRTR